MKHFTKALFVTLLLIGAALYLYGNARLVAAVLCCVGLFFGLVVFRRYSRLGERISILAVALMGYTALYAASCLWGPYGSESLPNATSLLIGSAAYLLLLTFSRARMTAGLPAMFCAGSGVIALLSLDASSAQFLTPRILMPMLAHLGGPGLEAMQYEEAMRIVGVVGGANVLAGLLGIGTLLGLYLFLHTHNTHTREWHRWLAAMLLVLNASVFFLAFSMGAFCAFAVAAAAFLFLASPGERVRVFLCMALTALISLICAALMTRGLGQYGSAASFFTMLCPFAFGMLLAFVFPATSALLTRLQVKGSGKELVAITVGASAVVIFYVVLATTVSLPMTLTPWGTERTAYLAPGDYTIRLTSDVPVKLIIASQSRKELLDSDFTYLYNGTTPQASFTVPEEAGIVRFNFMGSGRLYEAAYDGVQKGELQMKSPLVPTFVTNRMQGVLFSKNILERLEMSRDGLKLFASSPLLGCGAGAFEAKAYRVQQHYYETKYVHNQYVQCLVDTGIVGLALFLFILGAAFLQVARRKYANPPLAAALLACLIMTAVHGFTEVVWSMHAYVLFLLVLMAICELAFPAPLKSLQMRTWMPRVYIIAVLGFSLAVTMHLFIQMEYRHLSENEFTPERIVSMCKMEPFSKEVYQLDYVCNYGADAEQSDEYLAVLRSRKSYEVNMLLLQYIYLPAWDEENIQIASREAYWDRHCDKEAVNALYELLVAYQADKLLLEGK